jgi:hypothetical protein
MEIFIEKSKIKFRKLFKKISTPYLPILRNQLAHRDTKIVQFILSYIEFEIVYQMKNNSQKV